MHVMSRVVFAIQSHYEVSLKLPYYALSSLSKSLILACMQEICHPAVFLSLHFLIEDHLCKVCCFTLVAVKILSWPLSFKKVMCICRYLLGAS
jgi:hypothetical protein